MGTLKLLCLLFGMLAAEVETTVIKEGDVEDDRIVDDATATFETFVSAESSAECCHECAASNKNLTVFVFAVGYEHCACYSPKDGVEVVTRVPNQNDRRWIPHPVSGLCASGNVIFITGGYGTRTSTEVLDPVGSCSRLTSPLPDRRSSHSISRLGDDLVLCGGENTRTSCISARSPGGPWVHHSQLTTDRFGHAGVATGETIHVFGGRGDSYGATAETTAETLEDLDGARRWNKHHLPYSIGGGPCAVEINNAVYITGGSSARTQTWKWNTDQQWTRLANIDGGGRRHHGCAAVIVGGHSLILVAGGHDGSNSLRTSAIYDIEENTWRPTGELNQVRSAGVMVNVGANVYMLGGTDAGRNVLNTVEKFNVATNEWVTTNFTMKKGRSLFSAVSVERSAHC